MFKIKCSVRQILRPVTVKEAWRQRKHMHALVNKDNMSKAFSGKVKPALSCQENNHEYANEV